MDAGSMGNGNQTICMDMEFIFTQMGIDTMVVFITTKRRVMVSMYGKMGANLMVGGTKVSSMGLGYI